MYDDFTTGAILSPPDARDYSIAATAGQYPATFMLPRLPGVRNQGGIGSCAPHSGCAINAYYDNAAFSTNFYYGYRPLDYHQGPGMRIRDLCNTMTNIGGVHEADFPGNTEMPGAAEKVNAGLIKLLLLAKDNKIERYARLYTSEELKASLYNGIPAIVVVWTDGGGKVDTDGLWIFPDKKTSSHAMAVFGWETIKGRVCFKTLNSWGVNWGKKGWCYIAEDDVNDLNRVAELWAVADTYRAELITRTLRKGHKGDDVKALQKALMARGYALPKWSADADFGSETEAAVKQFQKDNKLVVDGIFGPKSSAAMGGL